MEKYVWLFPLLFILLHFCGCCYISTGGDEKNIDYLVIDLFWWRNTKRIR